MSNLKLPRVTRPRPVPALVSAIVLILPAVLLAGAAVTRRGEQPIVLWVGAAIAALIAVVLQGVVTGRPMRSALTALPAVVGLVAFWLGRPGLHDPIALLTLGVLTVLATGLFAGYALQQTGATSLREAREIGRRLAARTEWPEDLDACRHVPEVKALREALRDEAAPAMQLLTDQPPAVRIAALAALEYRRVWRRGQPDLILEIAKSDPQAEIRAAALLALGGVNQRLIVEEMANSLRDPSSIVRQAAADALLWDCERRWIWVRHAVHEALADPRHARDGALTLTLGRFSEQAVSDLAAWATEAGTLGIRAAETLAQHYNNRIAESSDPKLLGELQDHVASSRSPAILRIELAQLLRRFGSYTPGLLESMLDPANPSPLRLFAVEALLQRKVDEKSIEVLRQVARQPNRELALQAAIIVQKYLHIDLGLEIGQPPPALHTRQAAEVTRRVIQWAEQSPITPPRPSSQLGPRPSHAGGSKTGSKTGSKAGSPLPDSVLSLPPSVTGQPAPGEEKKFMPLEWD
jgi:hypothetical protein